MTNEKMPKRIWAYEQDGYRDFENMAGWKENGIESDFEGAEYVRVGTANDIHNEPLRDGQYRWIKEKGVDYWQPALSCCAGKGDLHGFARCEFHLIAEYDDVIEYEEIAEIGHVIYPPAW